MSTHFFGDSAGEKANSLQPVLATRRASSSGCNLHGNMYHKSAYVDANSHYVAITRSFDGHAMSASSNEKRPTKYPVGEAWKLHNHDMQLMDPNFRASITPFNMSVNNTMSSSDHYRKPRVQECVS